MFPFIPAHNSEDPSQNADLRTGKSIDLSDASGSSDELDSYSSAAIVQNLNLNVLSLFLSLIIRIILMFLHLLVLLPRNFERLKASKTE